MVCFLSSTAASLLLSALALVPAASYTPAPTLSHEDTWRSEFRSQIDLLPKPTADCNVCFYEQPNFAGPSMCLGKRDPKCTDLNPIMTPRIIGSIKFHGTCELVVNLRVTDAPYDEHMDTIFSDVLDTGFNETAEDGHTAFKVYVEEAGRACFVGSTDYKLGHGKCYTEDAATLESRFQHSFYEVMLFKTPTTDFDVIAFEKEGFNTGSKTYVPGQEAEDSELLSLRFSGFSKDLSTDDVNTTAGTWPSLASKVSSIAFVAPETPMTSQVSSPGTVGPYTG